MNGGKVVLIITLVMIFASVGSASAKQDPLFKIENPGAKADLFGSAVAATDGKIIVGASDKEVDGTAFAGSVYVFDARSGSLLYTIDNPEPDRGDRFGLYVAATRTKILVGEATQDSANPRTMGKIYAFDEKDGSLAYTIQNPDGDGFDGWFGHYINIAGNNIVAPSTREHDGKVDEASFVFDGNNGTLAYTIQNPDNENRTVTRNIASAGNNIAIGIYDDDPNDSKYTNAIYVFDGSTGSLKYKIENPDPTRGNSFGNYIEATEDKIIAGVPDLENGNPGAIYVFDANTGERLYSIGSPGQSNDLMFGSNLATVGDSIVATSRQGDGSLDDMVYFFDSSDGSIVYTISDPDPNAYHTKNTIITDAGDRVALSHDNSYSFTPIDNPIYVYEIPRGQSAMPEDIVPYVAIVAVAGALAGIFALKKNRRAKKVSI